MAETSVGIKTISATTSVVGSNVLDNFDNAALPNLWAGREGVFLSTVTASYDAANAYGGSGYALKLSYSVKDNATYAGYYIELAADSGYANISKYKYLSFYIKGIASEKSLKVELKNKNNISSSLYVTDYLDGGITNNWQEVKIPLDAFSNLENYTQISQLVFVFENTYLGINSFPLSGAVYIDSVSFGQSPLSYVRIDHFGDNWGQNALGGTMGDMAGGNGFHLSMFSNISHNYARSLSSFYDVNQSGWCGIYMLFGNDSGKSHDYSYYSKLSFWAKAGAPVKVKIEIVDASGTHSAILPDDTTTPTAPISTIWQRYNINFSSFKGLDPASIKQMNIIYEDWRVGNRIGSVYYDEFQFEK